MMRMDLPIGVKIAPKEYVSMYVIEETDDLDLENDELFQLAAPGEEHTFSPEALFVVYGYLPIRGGFFLVKAESSECAEENIVIEKIKDQLLSIRSIDWNLFNIIG